MVQQLAKHTHCINYKSTNISSQEGSKKEENFRRQVNKVVWWKEAQTTGFVISLGPYGHWERFLMCIFVY